MVFCMFHRSKNLLRYVKNGYPSNWCQHWHPQHQKSWSRAFMQRAWYLWLCLKHWCCHFLVEGALVNFSGWGWLLIDNFADIECCGHCHLKRWLRAFMWRAWHLWLSLEHWCCHLLAEAAVVNYSGWGWLLFDVFSTIEHDCWLFDVIPIKKVIKGIHVKCTAFAALSWALMLLFACGSCSGEFFQLRMIVVWCFHHYWCRRHGKNHTSYIYGIAKGMRFFVSVLSANVVVYLQTFLYWIFVVQHNHCCLMLLLSLPSKEVTKGIHTLLTVVIPNHSYFLPNSIHTCYTLYAGANMRWRQDWQFIGWWMVLTGVKLASLLGTLWSMGTSLMVHWPK